jgi:hypothetical protein
MTIHLHIDELVLDGFPSVDRFRIAAAVETELARLLAEQGAPPSLRTGAVDRLDGGSFNVARPSRPEAIGVQVAQAIYGGLAR